MGSDRVARPALVAFDIIETVFAIEPLDGVLAALGLPEGSHRRLYAETLRDAMALASVGQFAPFVACMKGALAGMLAERSLPVDEARMEASLAIMRDLPPHPDAREALETLRDGGVRVVALSNGAASATQVLFGKADLTALAERILSVESVSLAKPRAEVYRFAAREAGLAPERIMMVACHPWDLNGAKAAGLATGYVARGKPFPPTMAQPDIAGETLAEVARAVVALPVDP